MSQTTNEVRIFLQDEALEKISKLKGRFAHKHPYLSNSELVEILLDLALEQTDPGRETERTKRRNEPDEGDGPKSAEPRRKPGAKLKREVFREAHGKCQICGSHHALEDDHRIPFALGGPTTKANLRLLCRNCNQRERVRVFGPWGSVKKRI